MSIIGKLHEISFYGLIVTIVCLITKTLSINTLLQASIHPSSFSTVFICYLFWSTVLYIPIALVGAFSTKYRDGGEGLLFTSNHIWVIIFSHIAEEILGLILTPFWFLKDAFTKEFTVWKVVDYIMYFCELVFIAIGLVAII